MELFDYPLFTACFLLLFMKSMGYLASHRLSKYGEWFVLSLLSIVPIGGFILLIWLNNRFGITVVQFGTIGNIILFCLAAFIFIGCSIWSKSLVLIIIPTLLYVPKYVLTYTQLSKDLQMILSYFISILGIAFYLFLLYGKEKGIDITYLTVHGEKEISDTLAVYEAVLSKMI
ncbi:HAAS domain-containing protein [Caldibacillus thermoamylovorans]